MGALDMITKAPEFQKFQAQLQALLAMVQATDARTRQTHADLAWVKEQIVAQEAGKQIAATIHCALCGATNDTDDRSGWSWDGWQIVARCPACNIKDGAP